MSTLADIQAQIAALQIQAEEIRKAEFDSVVADIKQKIASYGITAKDLGLDVAAPAGKKRGSVKGEVAPKYQKGDDTWSGRGRTPRFIQDHIAAGGTLEDLLIQK
ncbi:H-NS histone family protein [Undibacterium squillarum]|uniref:H-NS histone n=1 Tax=Undibacterium squillarum TaxID=1131567 RepID=A0ABQ2XQG6_9BURK|nr:H-NS histone family protein [Undibacterium squillarum]GGX28035.1 H-NS histone [Undibacterium squillarum]